jgi:hypothetical protein
MSEDRYPELTACNAAKQALDDFDVRHQAKKDALIKLGQILQRGGWNAVQFMEKTRFVPPAAREPGDDENMISLRALEGDTVEAIVEERKRLLQQWELAYEAVPAQIRAAAPQPPSLRARQAAKRSDRLPRR